MASKLTAGKGKKIVKAIVEVAVGGDRNNEYNHATISLHTADAADGYNRLLMLTFQRHSLTHGYNRDRYENLEAFRGDLPPVEFDIGTTPYSKFYGGNVDGRSDFDPTDVGANKMILAAKVIQKVVSAMRVYNIHAVSRDELESWMLALKKLDVDVVIKRWIGNVKYENYFDIPENLLNPALKTFNTRWDAAQKAQPAAQ